MRPRSLPIWGLLIVVGLLGCPSLRAQSQIAGTYRCTHFEVGKRSGRCISPPLTLWPDGTYRIWGEEGTYLVRGRWLVLSQAKKRGRGRVLHNGDIVFQYTLQGQKHKVIFERRDYAPTNLRVT